MTLQIDLDQLSDYVDAVRVVATELDSGKVVAVPDEVGVLILSAAGGSGPPERIAELSKRFPQSIQVATIADYSVANDYIAELPRVYEKLARRCWPGPVVIRLPENPQAAPPQPAPSAVNGWGKNERGCAFYVPGHRVAYSLLGELATPMPGLLIPEPEPDLLELSGVDVMICSTESTYPEGPTVITFDSKTFQTERAGVVSERVLRRLTGEVYLFVCTGNTCRSPMAEGLFRRMLAEALNCQEDELLDHGYTVISAGLGAHSGAPASREAVELLSDLGIDLRTHESQPVTEELLFHCDHILTMTNSHRESILQVFPELNGKVRMLSPDNGDVSDPFGGSAEDYKRCRNEIEEFLKAILPKSA